MSDEYTGTDFTGDLGELLSTYTSELLDLTVQFTPLKTIPDALCRLSNIRSLTLSSNQLLSLPSNCFTRMRSLRTFSAAGNRLTSLQVRRRSSLWQYFAEKPEN